MNWLFSTLTLLCICYLSIAAGMYISQRGFMYLPDRRNQNPDDVGLSGVNVAMNSTSDGQHLQSWHVPAKPGRPTILYFHGNAGSIADRADRLRFFQKQGLGALFVSYRGYGASTGSPSQSGLMNDALAAHDWLVKSDILPDNIIAVGESLGAAVVVQLAQQRSVRAVILEAPFTSTMDVARATYWWLPVDLLMKDRFESIKLIHQIKAPILIVHGARDEITSVEQGRQLFAKAREPKTLYIIDGASHNGISVEDVWLREQVFIENLIAPAAAPDPS